jgi:hypothetical protein
MLKGTELMVARPRVLDHLGDYGKHEPMGAFSGLSERAWDLFHTVMGGHEKHDNSDRDYLITRLMYISEGTSTAIRLNASWALTHPAMSLTRDRYEQIVRFSWLARQKDDTEMQKFFAYYHARANKIFRSLKEGAKEQFSQIVDDPPEWTTRVLTKEERQHFEAWETLDLLSMARKRDKLAAFGTSDIATQLLEFYYAPIYQQFSSVSHSDMYSVALLELHKSPTGAFVLSADPHWPATLVTFNALFDIIQCYECAAGVYQKDCEPHFQSLFGQWHAATIKAFGP